MNADYSRKLIVIFFSILSALCIASPICAQKISQREVTDRVNVFHVDGDDDGVNLIVVEGRFSLLLINTAWHPLTTQIVRNLIADSFDNLPVEFLINLSPEPHNTAGNQEFPDAVIIAHRNTSTQLRIQAGLRIENLESLRSELASLVETGEDVKKAELENKIAKTEFAQIVLPARTVNSDIEIPLPGAAVHLKHYPGAVTNGDLIAIVPSERTLITGDLIRNQAVPYWNPELGGSFRGLLKATESLMGYEDQYKHVIPGRGPAGGFEIIHAQHSYLLALFQTVTTAKAEGMTLEQAKQDIQIDEYASWVDYDRLFPQQIEHLWKELDNRNSSTERQ